jgi:hypothetical protein
MATRGEIERLHIEAAQLFMGQLDGECEINTSPQYRALWHRRDLRENVSFDLSRKDARQVAMRAGGRSTCLVAPAKKFNEDWSDGERIWVAWRDIWTRKAHDVFELVDASLTFFWGRPSIEPIRQQLFRAEWPQKSSGGVTSAQPHWQVDWPLADLETLVSGIHFGMAGWECEGDGEHLSKHWRRFADNDTVATLQQWAVRTLEYAVDQIVQFYPKDLV